MCGIVGLVSTTPVADRSRLELARDTIVHRGPDSAGVWWSADQRIGFAHRRLAIIDLSPAGHQPMESPERDTVIVFNGEIYNYQDLRRELQQKGHVFRSQSDTEVILAAYREWGDDCIARLNGAFAFAIHDIARQRVLMARDRAGEKPLFYAADRDGLRFGSEIKALLTLVPQAVRVNALALDCYLGSGYVPRDLCMVEGIHKLQPGQSLAYDLASATCRCWQYWDLPEPMISDQALEDQREPLLQELETLLQDAVARQMVADVPIGILLSGGVDSSLLTALAVRTSSRVKTFTIRFPGHGNYDETPHARLIADHFRTDHVELEASDTSVDLLPRLARQFDEPMSDSSMVPTFLISQEIRRHCTVAIGGDGGDELFGGYAHYDHILRQESRLARLPGFVRRGVAAGAAQFLPTGYRGRNYLRGYGMRLGSGQLPLALFDAVSRRKLLRGMPGWEFGAEAKRERIDGVSLDLVQRMTRSDFRQYLPEDILVKVDRASMLNSLEVRAPFLDYRLIDFAFGRVPSDLKTSGDNRKILLKLLARRLLPEGFDLKRKQGFSIPLASWLEAPAYRDYFRDILLGASDSPFDRRYVKSLLAGQAKGRSNSERLFNLLMFELWRTEYGAIVR